MKNEKVEAFIERWRGVTGSERANYQLFITGLCDLLELPIPDPASDDTRENSYVFERRITFSHGDGSASPGFIDCYKRGSFVLEAKKVKAGVHTQGFDDALMRARAQGERYARSLPAPEGRPPFVIVVDVGHVIEMYSEFTRSGATYTPFPDARSHRIKLDDLRDDAVRQRLTTLWLDPMELDPSRASAKVTRKVAFQLANVARSLEADGHSPHDVAAFLTRCLFSMFAEDVGLLPRLESGEGAFVGLLRRYAEEPATLQRMMRALWADMDGGGFSAALAEDVLRFNGKLFKGPSADGYALPLSRDQIDDLLVAAQANWREVEPSIFGSLLERALDPTERHALGAHYTPRAYVERLVLPTIMEPLRAEWADAQAAALLLANEANELEGRRREDKLKEARKEIQRFHHRLCTVRILDPACGSGNFLYVTLEHLKRLEGEVFIQLAVLGETQAKLGFEGETVTLQQLRGIELNERAAALAELVLWIGFLQWHIRTFGNASVAEPVIHDYGSIEFRDAVLAYDAQEPMKDNAGNIVTRWDGAGYKPHHVTGQPVPDEAARVVQWRYVNPRKAQWPTVDFIVGNPPFIGKLKMREALGDGYTEALREVWQDVPDSADFVMYWWAHAAKKVAEGQTRRFGLITTKAIVQTFNRRVVSAAFSQGVGLVFAIPNHPWVDSARGAAVRIAMTVGSMGVGSGRLLTVAGEHSSEYGELTVEFTERTGAINADLSVGANVMVMMPLLANRSLSNTGVIPHGTGMLLTPQQAATLEPDAPIRPYRNGRDLTNRARGLLVIDCYGLTAEQVRRQFPRLYQWLLLHVKPTRDVNRDKDLREKWWLHRRSNDEMRRALAGLPRYIATVMTAKHRLFQFLDGAVTPDQVLVTVASDDALHLGVLSSYVHAQWAIAAGGRLGVGNDPRYAKTRCFEAFPFPDDDTGLTPQLREHIRTLAEQIDAHRKAQQAVHRDATLTDMYNVLEKLRNLEPLTGKDRTVLENGLVVVLRTLHDDLDNAVLAAYGWSDLTLPADTAILLERLVNLNTKRADEEAAGTVRWLRPNFQRGAAPGEQGLLEVEEDGADAPKPTSASAPTTQRLWPVGLPEQIKAVADVLGSAGRPLTLDAVAANFTARGRWRDRLPTILETLEALGRARRTDAGGWRDAS